MDRDQVMQRITEAFERTTYPGDEYLQGSFEGCEPFDVVEPFKGRRNWKAVEPAILEDNPEALSFFSEGAFRFFLPAYLVVDLRGQLDRADPLFHLTHGFSERTVRLPTSAGSIEKNLGGSALVNPRRYGAMTASDYARFRLAVFVREEARAITGYLRYVQEKDPQGLDAAAIDAALDSFWLDRAEHAPTHDDLARYLEAEARYLRDLGADPER